jgi:hypothetical protein
MRNFLSTLTGREKVAAFALVKLLEERGNTLRLPHSRALGDGILELRAGQVRICYLFLPGKRVVLLDGIVKKQDAIPVDFLKRVRAFRREVLRREGAA